MRGPRSRRTWIAIAGLAALAITGREARSSGVEVKVERDFLAGVVEKVPPFPFDHQDRYRGTGGGFRLLGIDPKTRQFHVLCKLEGEFRDRIGRGKNSAGEPRWKKFRFEVRASIRIEAGNDGTPRFAVTIDDVRREEMEGFAGAIAKVMGGQLDLLVTKIAAGKAALLNEKINAEVTKKIAAFREYGVFCGIDYHADHVVLRFDVTRFRSEGIACYLLPSAAPGTVPLYRYSSIGRGGHFYSTNAAEADPKLYRAEGLAGHVFDHAEPGTVPLYRWSHKKEKFYTTAKDGEAAWRLGFRLDGVACHVYPTPQPESVPLYRFVDPRNGGHFYTTHPHAEFAK